MVTMSDQLSAQAKKCKLLQGQLIESQRQLKATRGALEATTRERDTLKEGVGTTGAGAGIERAPEADAEVVEAQRARQQQAEDRAVIDRLRAEAKEHCAIIMRLQSSNLDLKVNFRIIALFNHCSFLFDDNLIMRIRPHHTKAQVTRSENASNTALMVLQTHEDEIKRLETELDSAQRASSNEAEESRNLQMTLKNLQTGFETRG